MQANFLPNLAFGENGLSSVLRGNSIKQTPQRKPNDATMIKGLETFLTGAKSILPPIGRTPVGTVNTNWQSIVSTKSDTFQKGVQAGIQGVEIRSIDNQTPDIKFAKKPLQALANLARAISGQVISVAEKGTVSRIQVPDLAKLAKKVK